MQYTTNYNLAKPDASDVVNPNSRNAFNTNVDTIDTQLKAVSDNVTTLINLLVPVGVVLTFAGDVDPNDIYAGTTWVLLKDTFLLGKGDTYTTLGATGGASSHTHTLDAGYARVTTNFASDSLYTNEKTITTYWASTNGRIQGITHDSYTSSPNYGTTLGGSTDSTSSMPPYTVVNFWKRTA